MHCRVEFCLLYRLRYASLFPILFRCSVSSAWALFRRLTVAFGIEMSCNRFNRLIHCFAKHPPFSHTRATIGRMKVFPMIYSLIVVWCFSVGLSIWLMMAEFGNQNPGNCERTREKKTKNIVAPLLYVYLSECVVCVCVCVHCHELFNNYNKWLINMSLQAKSKYTQNFVHSTSVFHLENFLRLIVVVFVAWMAVCVCVCAFFPVPQLIENGAYIIQRDRVHCSRFVLVESERECWRIMGSWKISE